SPPPTPGRRSNSSPPSTLPPSPARRSRAARSPKGRRSTPPWAAAVSPGSPPKEIPDDQHRCRTRRRPAARGRTRPQPHAQQRRRRPVPLRLRPLGPAAGVATPLLPPAAHSVGADGLAVPPLGPRVAQGAGLVA